MSEYLTLREIVEQAEIQLGQSLIPISAFGYNYARLEKIFVESIKYFEQWYPLELQEVITLSQDGTVIPNAICISSIRYNYGKFVKSTPKLEKRLYQWYPQNKLLKSEVNLTGLVNYLAHYPVGYLNIQDQLLSDIYNSETVTEIKIKGHFKRGTLTFNLDEGVIPESTITVNTATNEIVINSVTGKLLYTGSVVSFRTTDTLPNPLTISTEYYLIKLSDTIFKLTSTLADALSNTNIIDLTNTGVGTHYMSPGQFKLTEQDSSYNFYTSETVAEFSANTFSNIDILFMNRLNDDSYIKILSTGTVPTPLVTGTQYYPIIVDSNTIKLAVSLEDALLGNAINITNNGTGVLTIQTQIVLSDNRPDNYFIHLYGSLGKAEINLNTLTGNFYNIYGWQGALKHSFVSKYKAVEHLSFENQYNDSFFLVFKWKFAEALGRQKMTVRLDGLPIDITADDLLNAQDVLKQDVRELFTESRSKWWIF